MGNKIITEKDFWKCSSGAAFAQLQGTRTSNKKSTGEVYITVADTSTSSWIDFGCTKNMMLAAIIGALVAIVVAVAVVAFVVGTGGLGAIALIGIGGMMAIGAVGGVAGGLIMAAKGALQCGHKNSTARSWDASKDDLILTKTQAITGNRTMTCTVGGVVKFAPEVKSWMHALALSGLNYVTELAGCALGGAGVGALVFAGAGVAGGSLALGWPTLPSIMSNVLQGFTGIWGSSRVLFGLDNVANEHAMGNVNDGWDAFKAVRDGGIPEYGMAGRLLTGHAQPTDYMLFLYLLNIKAKTTKPPVEEPTTSGDKDGNNNNKGNQEEPQNKTPEEDGANTSKGKGNSDDKSKGSKDADAYEDPKPKKPKDWSEHEANVTDELQTQNPDVTVGEQITLDVTGIDANGKPFTTRIKIDNLHETSPGTYQLTDAKFSSVKDLTSVPTTDLRNTFTNNQKPVYDAIGGKGGAKITEIKPAGQRATDMGLKTGKPINVEPKVKVAVNDPNGGIIYRDYP
ncbi:hypothetical protein [Sphingobacterium athyrii]|uniref:DUF4280 domain-containing protein n=1 Tax=Sphingobacterium athyrii TaxID=2152717 RepID=A0A363NUK6_9SPHI|nr:hypothetical protein [Sphingobacterium athyrii]PUV24398.1 hypothetical protein DCO56_13720 [Sphingobacterium athyrii]